MATPSERIRIRADEVQEGDTRRLIVDEADLASAISLLNRQELNAVSAKKLRKPKMPLFKNEYVREFLAEFLGTFILIVFGNGAVAEVVLSGYPGRKAVNDFFSINIAYGLAVAFGVYVAGGVSGGHLNPAVSLAFAFLRKLKWKKLPVYMAAQYIGAWFGSAVIMMVYYDALREKERQTNTFRTQETAGIFASYPQTFLSWQNGLFDQIFGTLLLMVGILALTDERNTNPHKGVVPLLVGLLVAAIGLSFGFNCGYPINPARDLGPRIFTAMAGWGSLPFSVMDYNWFWIPVLGPHLGALLGVAIYKYFIQHHWPKHGTESGEEPRLVVHSVHTTIPTITATPHYQPLKASQSAYSQEFR